MVGLRCRGGSSFAGPAFGGGGFRPHEMSRTDSSIATLLGSTTALPWDPSTSELGRAEAEVVPPMLAWKDRLLLPDRAAAWARVPPRHATSAKRDAHVDP